MQYRFLSCSMSMRFGNIDQMSSISTWTPNIPLAALQSTAPNVIDNQMPPTEEHSSCEIELPESNNEKLSPSSITNKNHAAMNSAVSKTLTKMQRLAKQINDKYFLHIKKALP